MQPTFVTHRKVRPPRLNIPPAGNKWSLPDSHCVVLPKESKSAGLLISNSEKVCNVTDYL